VTAALRALARVLSWLAGVLGAAALIGVPAAFADSLWWHPLTVDQLADPLWPFTVTGIGLWLGLSVAVPLALFALIGRALFALIGRRLRARDYAQAGAR
jgi:hypothetical protein